MWSCSFLNARWIVKRALWCTLIMPTAPTARLLQKRRCTGQRTSQAKPRMTWSTILLASVKAAAFSPCRLCCCLVGTQRGRHSGACQIQCEWQLGAGDGILRGDTVTFAGETARGRTRHQEFPCWLYAPWDFRTSEVSRMKVFEQIL